MSKKVVHELSVDDLIKLVQGSAKPIVVDGPSEAANFIFALNIRHGDTKIPAELIYFTYKQWKGWDKRPQPKPFFFRDFTKQFEKTRTNEGISYLLDPRPFDLSQEQFWLMKKDSREHRAKQKKKTTKT